MANNNNWVDLPEDLLEMICNHLISPDCMSMQLVCKSWWLILKKSSSRLRELPLLMMLPQDKEEDPDARELFSLSKQKIFTIKFPEMRGKCCCGSFQNGWLMTVDIDLNICLFHPWSKKQIELPHQPAFKQQTYVDDKETYTIEEILDRHISKVALSDDANMVVVIYGHGRSSLCRIGDKEWSEIGASTFMQDVIYRKGQFYSLSRWSVCLHLLRIEDGVNPWWEDLTQHLQRRGVFYLVPDIFTDSMFVIIRRTGFMDENDDEVDDESSDEEDEENSDDEEDEDWCWGPPIQTNYRWHITNRFEIYKTPLGEEEEPNKKLKNKMTKVESIEDRIVFLGRYSSMIFMASEFPGFKGNHIYFADNSLEQYYDGPFGCCFSGVFNVEDGTVEQLFIDRFHPMSLRPLWIATPPYSYSFQRDFGEKLRLE